GKFKMAARNNAWSLTEKAGQLVGALDGKALQVLLDLAPDEMASYDVIATALDRRFGRIEPVVGLLRSLATWIRGPREKLGVLAADVLNLAWWGYPDYPPATQGDLAMEAFVHNAAVSGLSKTIQNDLIECAAEDLASFIDSEIMESPFFTCKLDEATDITQCSQLSMVLCYVDGQGCVQECFTGFKDMSTGHNAASQKALVDRELERYQYKDKLVSQSYDGAALMAGELRGLQVLVKKDTPQALFVHCFAHRLNLVLQQGAQCIKETHTFFPTLEGLSAFFSWSSKRTHLMDEILKRRIPTLCTIMWSSRIQVLRVILEEREYGNLTDEIIRDQVIDTCLSSRLRRRLLRESDLTLDKALTIARAQEASEHQASHMESSVATRPQNIFVQCISKKMEKVRLQN
ncbi:ZMYM1 protein, partial [Polyodon spathula]|nr:ZMYM1 protein [Polyodon spathula]